MAAKRYWAKMKCAGVQGVGNVPSMFVNEGDFADFSVENVRVRPGANVKCQVCFREVFSDDPEVCVDAGSDDIPIECMTVANLLFECALNGCHQGVGHVKVIGANGVMFDGYPEGTILTSKFHPGTIVSVGYTQDGGHCCDRAVFDVYLASPLSIGGQPNKSVLLGTANLNNASDCGDRGPFMFYISQSDLDAISS